MWFHTHCGQSHTQSDFYATLGLRGVTCSGRIVKASSTIFFATLSGRLVKIACICIERYNGITPCTRRELLDWPAHHEPKPVHKHNGLIYGLREDIH